MTREIKFRQPLIDMKSKDFKGFHYWGYDGTTFIAPMTATNYANTGNLSDESIGTPDKNGDEIYGGDIVQDIYDKQPLIVRFNENLCGYYPFSDIDGEGYFVSMNMGDVEILGNIYENHKLLEA